MQGVSRPILIVAPQLETLLGLSHALLKFGFQIMTAYPQALDVERGARMQPSLVVICPPAEPADRTACLDLVRTHFLKRGIAVLACVPSEEEARTVQDEARGVRLLVGMPLRLNELYLKIQEVFDTDRRRQLRIRTEMAVAHREPGMYSGDQFRYDTMTSLALGGCYIRTDSPYVIGTQVEIVFSVGRTERSIRALGVVRRHGSPATSEAQGMGLEFESLPEPGRSALETFLLDQLGTLDLPSAL
jgi:Tfp pilus assembly protein PilZ